MNRMQKVVWLVVILAIVTLACNAPGNTALSEADAQATSVAETVRRENAEIRSSPG